MARSKRLPVARRTPPRATARRPSGKPAAEEYPVVILGGGLTGISAAIHLGQGGHNFLLLEKEDRLGGTARSEQRDGFTFDATGHWLHLRDPDMQRLAAGALPGRALERVSRKARIFLDGRLTRYPFQANLQGLSPAVAAECLLGFVRAAFAPAASAPPATFEDYVLRHFGEGIAGHFMIPYNRKLWGVEPRQMTADWCSRFVPIPRLEEVVGGAVGALPPEMGYNVSFLYPRRGGIETLTRALASRIEGGNLRTSAEVDEIDLRSRTVKIGGERIHYRALVSTIPLPELCRRVRDLPADAAQAASRLRHSSLCYLNLALRRTPSEDYHWIYVPEQRYPFYRVGVYSNAMPGMAPPGCASLYVELSERRRPRSLESLLRQVIPGLMAAGAMRSAQDLLFAEPRELDYAYVIFDGQHQQATATLRRLFESQGVDLCGRYGSWTYNSMEDCLLEGRKVARRLTAGPAPSSTAVPRR